MIMTTLNRSFFVNKIFVPRDDNGTNTVLFAYRMTKSRIYESDIYYWILSRYMQKRTVFGYIPEVNLGFEGSFIHF